MTRITIALIAIFAVFSVALAQDDAAGTVEFRANGEDFVRQGFVSKDGWNVNFDHIFVSLTNIRAHQTTPPYDPFAGELTRSDVMIGLAGQLIVDLAEGDADADTILVGTVEDAPAGFYNAVGWMMTPALDGDIEGFSLVMNGTAEKDGETIEFMISIDDSFTYTCGSFVGDERKGILEAGATSDVEMTFHFDHIFGDADAPMDDAINTGAPGFDVFAALAEDGVVEKTMDELEMEMAAEDYQMFVDILPSLGHTGEGHCHEAAA